MTLSKPLKAKNGNEMMKAITKIIRDNERCPKNLNTEERNFTTRCAETLEDA